METGNLLIGYIVVGVLGGSLLTAVVQKLFDRKKDASSIRLSEGDQTLKWSEKALQIIDELIETKRQLAECEDRCRDCDENR